MSRPPTGDPRWRRAERIRQAVLAELTARRAPATRSMIHIAVRNCAPGSVVPPYEVARALQVLRRAGRVRYVRPKWELVA